VLQELTLLAAMRMSSGRSAAVTAGMRLAARVVEV
jgi:hypothetical protein